MANPLARQRALEVLLAGEAPPMALGTRPLRAPVSMEEAAGPVEGVEMVEAMPPAPSEYERIQRQANEASLGVELGRAGAMLGEAISGARAPMAAYDGLAQQAQAPVAQYLERRQAEAAAQKAEQESALRDPFSPESRRRQAAFQRANPTLGKRLGLDQSPYAWSDLESVIKGTLPVDSLVARSVDQEQRARDLALKEQTEQRRAGEFTATLEQRKAEALQRAKDDAARRGLDWAKLSIDQQRLLLDAAAKQMEFEGKKAKAVTDDIRAFGEEVVKAGAPGFYERFDRAKQLISTYGRDLPGIGRLDGRKPDEALSPDGREMRMVVGQLLSEYRKGQTGAGMSDSERAEYSRITGLLDSGNDDAISQGVDLLGRALDARIKATAASYRPEAVEEYSRRNPRIGKVVAPAQAQQPTRTPDAGGPSRPDRKLDSTKTEERRSYSKDGKWMKVYYTDGTYGLAPSDKR